MQMRPEVQIASMIKAMKDVVIPALADTNRLATEQAQLVVGMLHLMESQLPLQFRFDRDELVRLQASAGALLELATNDASTRHAVDALAARRAEADKVLQECRRDAADLHQAVRNLRESVCQVIDACAASADVDSQLMAERILLAMSKEQLLRDRALMKSQGWEPDPAAVPAVEQLLAAI